MSLNQLSFLRRFNFSPEEFERSGWVWVELVAVHDAYLETRLSLDPDGNYVAERLRQLPQVHSVRTRTKDPEHLIEKLIRKRLADHKFRCSPSDYMEVVTDLVGIRALHLFKGEWLPIHQFITATWKLREVPQANIREGDPPQMQEMFEKHGCVLRVHPAGYRSVHYLPVIGSSKAPRVAEIQVRTIFEEGWSEIDHKVQYPRLTTEPLLKRYLVLFNRLAGSADEMGTFLDELKSALERSRRELDGKNTLIEDLRKQISSLTIQQSEKDLLESRVAALAASPVSAKDDPSGGLLESMLIFDPRVPYVFDPDGAPVFQSGDDATKKK